MKKILLSFLIASFPFICLSKENVELIVASSPGGSVHRYALHIQPALENALSKNVILTFKPGGNGLIAARELQNSPKDKLTFLIGNLNLPEAWKDNFKNQKVLDVQRDITPVAFLGTIPSIIYSKSNKNYSDFREALNYGKKENLTIAIAMNSPNSKLVGEIVSKNKVEENLTIVPFKTGTQGLLGVLGGHVTMGITVIDVLTQEIEKNTIVPLALVYESRLKAFSALPTLKELGLSIDNEDRYYNNFFLWTNVDKNTEEIIRVKNVLNNFLTEKQSEKFISSLFVQFGKNDIRNPEKYLEKLIK